MGKKLDIKKPEEIRDYIMAGLNNKGVDKDDIEDMANSIFMRVSSSLNQKSEAELSEMNISGFVFKCVSNYIIDVFRKANLEDPSDDISRYSPIDDMCIIQVIDFKRFFLKAENDEDFKFLVDVFEKSKNMTFSEIAIEQGLTLANLKTRIYRARQRLKLLDITFYDEYIKSR